MMALALWVIAHSVYWAVRGVFTLAGYRTDQAGITRAIAADYK